MLILEIHRSITGWNSCTSNKALMNDCSTKTDTTTAAATAIVSIATVGTCSVATIGSGSKMGRLTQLVHIERLSVELDNEPTLQISQLFKSANS